jgi:putative membrane protein
MVAAADSKFLREAAEGGMMEVQAARMAQEKATSENVKAFAKQLEQDHSKANEELKQLAAEKKVDLPADLGEKHQKHISKLEKLSGAEFDREYMKLMVDDHKKDVKSFKKQADRAMDSDVKTFAADKVPVLEQHLSQAQQLNAEVRGSGTRARSVDSTTDEHQVPQTRPTDPTTNDRDRSTQPQGQNNPTTQP